MDLLLVYLIFFGGAFLYLFGAGTIVLLDPGWRAKLLRFVSKKNWGVIEVVRKGRRVDSYVRNFSNKTVKIGNETYAILPEFVYLKQGLPTLLFNKSLETHTVAEAPKSHGLPGIEFSERDALPQRHALSLEILPEEEAKKLRDPKILAAINVQQRALAKKQATQQMQMIFICVVVAAVASAVAAMTGVINMNTLGELPGVVAGVVRSATQNVVLG